MLATEGRKGSTKLINAKTGDVLHDAALPLAVADQLGQAPVQAVPGGVVVSFERHKGPSPGGYFVGAGAAVKLPHRGAQGAFTLRTDRFATWGANPDAPGVLLNIWMQ